MKFKIIKKCDECPYYRDPDPYPSYCNHRYVDYKKRGEFYYSNGKGKCPIDDGELLILERDWNYENKHK